MILRQGTMLTAIWSLQYRWTDVIRKNSTIRAIPRYKHRSSIYHMANNKDVQAIILEVKGLEAGALPAVKLDKEEIKLPPKRPTPNVILRDDIMPKQRMRVIL